MQEYHLSHCGLTGKECKVTYVYYCSRMEKRVHDCPFINIALLIKNLLNFIFHQTNFINNISNSINQNSSIKYYQPIFINQISYLINRSTSIKLQILSTKIPQSNFQSIKFDWWNSIDKNSKSHIPWKASSCNVF